MLRTNVRIDWSNCFLEGRIGVGQNDRHLCKIDSSCLDWTLRQGRNPLT